MYPGSPPRDMNMRQWKGFLFSASVRFVDHYYLHPDPEAGFDPLFYDDTPKQSPPFHEDILTSWAYSRFTESVCPRGSAKSGLACKAVITRIITHPSYSYVYATSTNDLAKEKGRLIRSQCYENDRINDDFSREYGGFLKPIRGDNPTGVEYFYLVNGSRVKLSSTGSAQRGMRPRRYLLDDPEYDPSGSTSMSQLIADFDRMLFRIIMPMVLRDGTGIDWLATFVSKRHYAWRAMQGKHTPQGFVADDPRFNYWDRLQVNILERDPTTGELVSCWPDMWPLESDDLSASGKVSIAAMKELMGAEAFNSEMMGNPGDSGVSFFPPLNETHWFSVVDPDEPFTSGSPRDSLSEVEYFRKGKEGAITKIRTPLQTLMQKLRVFMCLDTSFTNTPSSDFKTALVMGYLPTHNELFILDGWSGQVPRSEQVKNAFLLADRWKCPLMYPEVVKESVVLYNDLCDISRTRAMEALGVKLAPKVVPLRPGMESKIEKISSLYLRFEHGLIKMPAHLKSQPWMLRLIEQAEGFNPQVADGGLAKDDELDTVAMLKFVLKGRSLEQTPTTMSGDPVEAIVEGEKLPLPAHEMAVGVNWDLVDPAHLKKLLSAPVTEASPRSKV